MTKFVFLLASRARIGHVLTLCYIFYFLKLYKENQIFGTWQYLAEVNFRQLFWAKNLVN